MYRASMDWLNYHHLRYFWVVVREGSISKASSKLRVAQPTISGQLRMLEESLGHELLVRDGRGLKLTEVGRVVFRYAEQIFPLGDELLDAMKGGGPGAQAKLVIGVADVIPKVLAYKLLAPVLTLEPTPSLVVHEDRAERLFVELAAHTLDLVLTDAPLPPSSGVKAYNHPLGDSEVLVMGTSSLIKRYRKGFPSSLDGAPMLLPTDDSSLGRALDAWLHREMLRPKIVARCADHALLKVFARAGAGLLVVPSIMEPEVSEQVGLDRLGTLDGLREQFYAISMERKIRHPAVAAILNAAREHLFG